MKVELIDFTGAGQKDPAAYAAAVTIFAKSTRLAMTPGLFSKILMMPNEEMLKELQYIANTIPSSWEFVHYTFLIEGVSRAFTHQFVRTRTASYAQQTMRVLNVSEGRGWEYLTGPSIPQAAPENMDIWDENKSLAATYHGAMSIIDMAYKSMIENGAKIEDARGVLPTNILTNIMVSMNMRTFVEMARKRSSPRTQGEYREVLDGMKNAAFSVHPWLKLFVERDFDKAAQELDKKISALDIPTEQRTEMIKLIDQMRAQS